jgi:hypothetical protein
MQISVMIVIVLEAMAVGALLMAWLRDDEKLRAREDRWIRNVKRALCARWLAQLGLTVAPGKTEKWS